MRSFLNFLNEAPKAKKKLNGVSFISLADFVTESLNEAAAPFLGAMTRKLPPQELDAYLSRIKTGSKEKSDKYKLPYIHGGNVEIVNDRGTTYDVDALRKLVTERPKQLLKQNEKMKHSDGTATQFYNIGLPALKGLAVDERTGEFIVVDTCPGAGSCQLTCYAMKGGYVQWKASSLSLTRVLNFLLNDPAGFTKMLSAEVAKAERTFSVKKVDVVVRWHDAGDFFSPDYMDLAYAVARENPTVNFYAYTKISSVASSQKPPNFLINFSAGALPAEERNIDFTKQKNSRIVPKSMFQDLITRDAEPSTLIQIDSAANKKKEKSLIRMKSPAALTVLKTRLAKQYNVTTDSILSYDEMQNLPKSGGAAAHWNVIVMPGQGDESASRKDVLGTFLLFH